MGQYALWLPFVLVPDHLQQQPCWFEPFARSFLHDSTTDNTDGTASAVIHLGRQSACGIMSYTSSSAWTWHVPCPALLKQSKFPFLHMLVHCVFVYIVLLDFSFSFCPSIHETFMVLFSVLYFCCREDEKYLKYKTQIKQTVDFGSKLFVGHLRRIYPGAWRIDFYISMIRDDSSPSPLSFPTLNSLSHFLSCRFHY